MSVFFIKAHESIKSHGAVGHKHTCKLFLKKKILFTPMLNPARRGANVNKEQSRAG